MATKTAVSEPSKAGAKKKTSAKAGPAKLFKRTVGTRPHTVRIWEDPERGYAVSIGWKDSVLGNARHQLLLDDGGNKVYVRKIKPGRVPSRTDLSMREAVVALGMAWQKTWQDNLSTRPEARGPIEAARHSHISDEDLRDAERKGLTVRRLFKFAYGEVLNKSLTYRRALRGKPIAAPIIPAAYTKYTEQAVERRDLADTVTLIFDRIGVTNAGNISWMLMLSVLMVYRADRRKLAEEKGGKAPGRRTHQKLVEVTTQAIRHVLLHTPHLGRGPVHLTTIPLKKSWRTDVNKLWDEDFEKPTTPPARDKRYTRTEMGLLMLASELETAPWRLRVMMAIGAAGQLGQVAVARRIAYEPDQEDLPHGVLNIESDGNKGGVMIGLTRRERTILDRMIAERHAAAEAEWLEKKTDYALFRADRRGKPVSARVLNAQWRELERLAGVEAKAGRAWYGARRSFADLHKEMFKEFGYTDTDILDALTGHGHQDTSKDRPSLRTTVYLSEISEGILVPGGAIRDAVWDKLTSDPKICSMFRENQQKVAQRLPAKPRAKSTKPKKPRKRRARKPRDINDLIRDIQRAS